MQNGNDNKCTEHNNEPGNIIKNIFKCMSVC
jgi:hypothetical protein